MSLLERFGLGGISRAAAISNATIDAYPAASPWSDNSTLKSVLFEHLYDMPGEAAPISRAAAMGLSTVAKARNTIAGRIGSFPLVVMQGKDVKGEQPLWAQQPEKYRTRSQTILWTVDSLIFYGRAFWLITERYADGFPKQFVWCPEDKATVDGNGFLTAAFGYEVPADSYIRFDAHHEGVLHFAKATLRKAMDTERAAANAAANPVPSIELHQVEGDDLSDKEIKDLLDSWRAARTARGGGVGYTNSAIEARTHGQAPEQLLIEGQNQAAIDLARAMGVPAWAVDASIAGSSMNYSNSAARAQELVDFGLQPYMNAITDRLSVDSILPRGTWVKFEISEFTAPPLKERLEAATLAINAGIWSKEEARNYISGIPLESKGNNEPEQEGEGNSSDHGDSGNSSRPERDSSGRTEQAND